MAEDALAPVTEEIQVSDDEECSTTDLAREWEKDSKIRRRAHKYMFVAGPALLAYSRTCLRSHARFAHIIFVA